MVVVVGGWVGGWVGRWVKRADMEDRLEVRRWCAGAGGSSKVGV